MFFDRLKKGILVGISSVMLVVPSISYAKESNKRESTAEKLKYFEEQYELNRDFDKALEELRKKYPSIKVKSKKETKVGGEKKPSGSNISPMSVYNFKYDESIIWDDDADQYVYLGEWWWGDIVGDQPWDFIGVFTNDENDMPISGGSVSIKGYDYQGKRTVYFDTANGNSAQGSIELATKISNGGVGFWFNEKYVESGLITAFLEDASTNSNDRIQMQYEHSRTSSSVTGVGVSAGLGQGGFSVSWQSSVVKDGPYWSTGAWLEN